ncbi:hypothetical protein PG984_000716 [Apiospora sp. TS-2023a]
MVLFVGVIDAFADVSDIPSCVGNPIWTGAIDGAESATEHETEAIEDVLDVLDGAAVVFEAANVVVLARLDSMGVAVAELEKNVAFATTWEVLVFGEPCIWCAFALGVLAVPRTVVFVVVLMTAGAETG